MKQTGLVCNAKTGEREKEREEEEREREIWCNQVGNIKEDKQRQTIEKSRTNTIRTKEAVSSIVSMRDRRKRKTWAKYVKKDIQKC